MTAPFPQKLFPLHKERPNCRPHPVAQGQQEGMLQGGSPLGMSSRACSLQHLHEDRKERTENMLIKSASGTRFGRVAKIL